MKLEFEYHGDDSPGLFPYLIEHSVNFSITSPDYLYLASPTYCYLEVESKPVDCIVDGTNKTAWRNNITENCYFIIDFSFSHFLLRDYVLKTVCYTIAEMKIEGSNDMTNWHRLSTKRMSDSGSSVHYHVEYASFPYHYFKFTRIQNGSIHLSQMEFYGVLNSILMNTCQIRPYPSYYLFSLFLLLNK